MVSLLCVCMCVSASTQWMSCRRTVLFYKDLLSGITGFMSSYTQDQAFSVVGRFFFLMRLYGVFFSFFHNLSVNEGETEGYVKLTAKEIAVKRSLHFSFSLTVFFSLYCQCYWPLVGIWIFKRHFISLGCSYSQGKGGKSCTVFLFYPPPSLDLQDELGSSFYISP